MDDRLVRLECLKLSMSPNLGLQDKLATAKAYEEYVMGESTQPSEPVAQERRKPGRPRKAEQPSDYPEDSEQKKLFE